MREGYGNGYHNYGDSMKYMLQYPPKMVIVLNELPNNGYRTELI